MQRRRVRKGHGAFFCDGVGFASIVDRLLNKIGAIDKIRKFEEIYNDKFKNIKSYEIFFEETSNTLNDAKKMINFIKDNMSKYGKQFEEFFGVNKLKVSIFSIFNSKIKSIKNAWEEFTKIPEKYMNIMTNI